MEGSLKFTEVSYKCMKKKKKRVVVIGGGTGTFVVLSALKNYPLNLSAIVSMADDGGSTGVLRDEYGVLPPGDIRRALVALSESSKVLRDLFNYRFYRGGLDGHSFGNLFLGALQKTTGSFASAVKEASRLLNIKGEVIPVTLSSVRLYAKLKDGKVIKGETNIDIPKAKTRAGIEKVWLKPPAKLNSDAKQAIRKADVIIIGPGDLYTSLIPNLLTKGLPEEIRRSRAKKIYIGNLMTKFGETDNFAAVDFVREIEKYLGKGVLDYAVFNNKKPSSEIIKKYKKERAEFVLPPFYNKEDKKPKYILADLINSKLPLRHSPQKLAKVILTLI